MNVLVFLGGEKPSPALARETARRAGLVVAADRGYHATTEAGLTPDIVTGDFDSIGSIPSSPDIRIVPAPEQDATDFEKALRHLPRETGMVEILGGTGLRSDHFLTNLLVAAGLAPELGVVFHDDTQSIHRITPHRPIGLSLHPGTIVSLIPFVRCTGVISQGLLWNLDNESLGPAEKLGQSNRADSGFISISIETGTIYLVVNHPARKS